jgi:hypothetical protein
MYVNCVVDDHVSCVEPSKNMEQSILSISIDD